MTKLIIYVSKKTIILNSEHKKPYQYLFEMPSPFIIVMTLTFNFPFPISHSPHPTHHSPFPIPHSPSLVLVRSVFTLGVNQHTVTKVNNLRASSKYITSAIRLVVVQLHTVVSVVSSRICVCIKRQSCFSPGPGVDDLNLIL